MPASAKVEVVKVERGPRASSGGAQPLQVRDWVVTPSAAPAGDSAGALALGMGTPGALYGTEEAQAEAGELFRSIIEPLVNPERFAEMHKQFPRRVDLVQHLAEQHQKGVRTIYRLLDAYQKGGITALTRKGRSDKGRSRALNTASTNFIIGAALPKPGSYGELSNQDVWRLHEEERRWREEHATKPLSKADQARYAGYVGPDGRFLPSAQLAKASYATFCRQIGRIPDLVKVMARKGEDAYRNRELISFRDFDMEPLSYVVMDHRVLDIFCLARDGRGWKLVRPWLTAAIDMRTRKWLGWCIVETPSSDSIATVLKQVFVNHGLPSAVYWDNGRDFRAAWLEGRRERSRVSKSAEGLPTRWTGVLETLGIRVHHAIVKNARAKLIEPNFSRVADFDRTLAEWCGHKPGARPERFELMLQDHEAWLKGKLQATPFRTIEQIADLYSLALENLNERELRGEGMRKVTPSGIGWMCPNECWELLIPRVARKSVPEEVLQLCFAKRRDLTVRNGEVQITLGGQTYHYRLVGNRTGLLGLNGRAVELAYDPLDMGRGAVYYDGRFVGLVECLVLRRMGEGAFVQDERDRRAARREVKKFIDTVHNAVPVPDAEAYLRRRAAVAPVRRDTRVEVPAELPESIQSAHSAVVKDTEFSFKEASMLPLEVERASANDNNSEFNFFD